MENNERATTLTSRYSSTDQYLAFCSLSANPEFCHDKNSCGCSILSLKDRATRLNSKYPSPSELIARNRRFSPLCTTFFFLFFSSLFFSFSTTTFSFFPQEILLSRMWERAKMPCLCFSHHFRLAARTNNDPKIGVATDRHTAVVGAGIQGPTGALTSRAISVCCITQGRPAPAAAPDSGPAHIDIAVLARQCGNFATS